MMKIDAHQHFWKYTEEEYDWIPEDVIRRDFGPADLEPLLKNSGLDGVISVQARTNSDENEFLLNHAAENDFIKAVVGYADLTQPEIRKTLEELAANKKLRGIREVLQGMEDDAYCLREDFNRGVAYLQEFGLVYDILIFHRHLPNAIRFVDRHPNQTFVLDHIAKPEIRSATPDPVWKKNMTELAKREHVYCKVSGMITEVGDRETWDVELLRPWFEAVLQAFGPSRLMFGSDWPVCLLKSDYPKWFDAMNSMIAELSADEQSAILGDTAVEAYRID